MEGLNTCLKALLKQVAWPPPLASDPASGPRSNKRPRAELEADNGPESTAVQDNSLQPADGDTAEMQDSTSSWDGFDAAGPVVRSCRAFDWQICSVSISLDERTHARSKLCPLHMVMVAVLSTAILMSQFLLVESKHALCHML